MAQEDVLRMIMEISNSAICKIAKRSGTEDKFHEALLGINTVVSICSGAILMNREEEPEWHPENDDFSEEGL